MSTTIPKLPVALPEPTKVYTKIPTVPSSPAAAAKPSEHHAAAPLTTTALSPTELSSADVSYVTSLMGAIPAQKMEEILLRTGIPIPANLGPNIDTSA